LVDRWPCVGEEEEGEPSDPNYEVKITGLVAANAYVRFQSEIAGTASMMMMLVVVMMMMMVVVVVVMVMMMMMMASRAYTTKRLEGDNMLYVRGLELGVYTVIPNPSPGMTPSNSEGKWTTQSVSSSKEISSFLGGVKGKAYLLSAWACSAGLR
jgi:hypothetical protein